MNKKASPPSYRVYAVTNDGKQSYWRAIGAVWPHSDGEGFNMKLDYLPLNSADIVIRKPRPGVDDAEALPNATGSWWQPAPSLRTAKIERPFAHRLASSHAMTVRSLAERIAHVAPVLACDATLMRALPAFHRSSSGHTTPVSILTTEIAPEPFCRGR